jgi:CarD family transcriptional regulator
MYKIGDLTFYKSHGVCRVDQITEESFTGKPMLYYVLQSKLRPGVTFYHPVESKNSQLEKMLSNKDALQIVASFKNPANEWEERSTNRHRMHTETLNRNDHFEIAQLMNTLLRKQIELQQEEKKLGAQDVHVLQQISSMILEMLELALKKPKNVLEQQIQQNIMQNC